NTPSGTSRWKCTLRLTRPPNRTVGSLSGTNRAHAITATVHRMTPPEGTEMIAAIPQGDLEAAVPQLVPAHFVRGEDARTPNQIRVYQRQRERAAALLWDLPTGAI